MLIKLTHCACDIAFTSENLNALEQMLQAYSSCAVITDSNIAALHSNQLLAKLKSHIPVHQILVPSGEKAKTLELASHCWSQMHRFSLDRKSLVIGFGGGVVTDLAGFAAGCYMRGIDVIHIPTTLMGMVDAAIGGKSGVNLNTGKNMIGVIHHPRQVIIAPHYLNTLPMRELRSGIAELIKYGVICDPKFFEYLEKKMDKILGRDAEALQYAITRSCEIKAGVVEQDEKDHGLRSILNWGHTFAHAIETLTNYEKYLHGEAVTIGMSCAAYTSELLGYAGQGIIERQDALCQLAGLPIELPEMILIDDLIDQMGKDKKSNSGKISLIIAQQIGKVVKVNHVEKALIKQALMKKGRH